MEVILVAGIILPYQPIPAGACPAYPILYIIIISVNELISLSFLVIKFVYFFTYKVKFIIHPLYPLRTNIGILQSGIFLPNDNCIPNYIIPVVRGSIVLVLCGIPNIFV